MVKYSGSDALREHMLQGNPVSLLEAMMLFGVQNPNAEFTRIKKDGFTVRSKRVPMTRLTVRLNKFASFEPPENLPHKEILMTEYWIEQ
ncbi:helix-turn-helix domain-containing protein [Paracoccaceae bacterium]|nr:helix-turn-helix domain-containing protein [Paracoccaceae bacterium]